MAENKSFEQAEVLQLQMSEAGIALIGAQQEIVGQFAWGTAAKIDLQFWEKHQIIPAHRSQIRVEIINPLFLLLPTEYDSALYRIGFLEKALGESSLLGHEIQEQSIHYLKSNLLFLVPSTWKDYLAIHFPLAQIEFRHVMAEHLEKSNTQKSQHLSIRLHQNLAYVALYKNYTLQVNNVFEYQSGIELAFYLHSIREAFDFPWDTQRIQITGPESTNEHLLAELQEYHISFAS